MLNKKDKIWIEETFKKLITEALTVEVRFEQKRDPETGVPLKVAKEFTKEVYLPAHWIEFLPFYEQAINLCQDSAQKAQNRAGEAKRIAIETGDKIDVVGKLYLDLERPLKVLAAFSDAINDNQISMNDHLKLVYKKDEGGTK